VRRIARTNQAFDGYKFLVSYLSFSFSQRFSYLANQNILNNSLSSPHVRCKLWSRHKMCKFWPKKRWSRHKMCKFWPQKKRVWKDGLDSAASLCLFFLPGCKQPRGSCKTKKSDSRLNLRQKLIPLKIGPGAVLGNYYPINVTLTSRRAWCYI